MHDSNRRSNFANCKHGFVVRNRQSTLLQSVSTGKLQVSQCPFIPDDERKRFDELREEKHKYYVARNGQNNDRQGQRIERLNNRGHRGGSSEHTKASVDQQGVTMQISLPGMSQKVGAKAASGPSTNTKPDE